MSPPETVPRNAGGLRGVHKHSVEGQERLQLVWGHPGVQPAAEHDQKVSDVEMKAFESFSPKSVRTTVSSEMLRDRSEFVFLKILTKLGV